MRQRSRARLRCLVGIFALAAVTSFGASNEWPNIVFILADDLGWRDLGCFGSTFYETPNLDALASRGMRFTDAYAACCVCSPTRASILTGKYPARLQLTDWLPGRRDRPDQKLSRPPMLDHLPLEEITIAESLKEAGYATGFFGKWHLGGPQYYPEKQGFDKNVGGCRLGSPPSYFSPYKIPTLEDGPHGEYLTDRLTQEALNFIRQSKDKPFFLYLSHYAVHNPQQAKTNLVTKYQAKAAKLKSRPRHEFQAEGYKQVRQIQNQPVYAAMVQSLDESVGRILKELNDLGLDEKTIIFFTSDNGGLSTAEGTPTSNAPLRAGKGWGYEGGVRVPLIVQWPGMTRPKSVSSQIVMSTDFYPTILQMAGLPLRPQQHVDGVTILPLFGGIRPGRYGFWHYPHYSNQGGGPYGAIRFGDFKLIEWYEDMRVELFDLAKDPGEHHDRSRELTSKVTIGRNLLDQFRESTHAAMPSLNPDYKSKPGRTADRQ
jgi:arylsulfatase A-like enzyme